MRSEASPNNFNLLRLTFSLLVALYHAILLPGMPGWTQLELVANTAAEIGVQGFFVLSGYLVWESLHKSQSIWLYAEKRARRLLPAYFAVVIACAIAALIVSSSSRADLASVGRYVGWNLTFLNFMEPTLPGLFDTNRFPDVNGALWTLKIEVMFYSALPILAWLLRAAGSRRWMLFVLIYASAEAWRFGLEHVGVAQSSPLLVELSRQLPGQMSFFIVGIALAAWRDSVNWRSPLPAFGVVLTIASMLSPAAEPVRALGLGITTVWLAVGVSQLFDAGRFGDLSYGLYVVHFPIIQGVAASGLFAVSVTIGLAVSLGLALIAALALWWLIERPALRHDSVYRLQSSSNAS